MKMTSIWVLAVFILGLISVPHTARGTVRITAGYTQGADVVFTAASGQDIIVSVGSPNNSLGRLDGVFIYADNSDDIIGALVLTNPQTPNPVAFTVVVGGPNNAGKEWRGFVVPSQLATLSTVLSRIPRQRWTSAVRSRPTG